jgi:hypothetical protein
MRLPSETKAQFAALAAHHQLTESGLLARLIAEVLSSNTSASTVASASPDQRHARFVTVAEDRITLRLRRGDRVLATERAGSRGMKTGSYLALLIHNHVHASNVLPPGELDAIKTTGAQLAALGRRLKMFDVPNTLTEPTASELRDLLIRVRHEVESAREVTAALVRRNLTSLEAGHA